MRERLQRTQLWKMSVVQHHLLICLTFQLETGGGICLKKTQVEAVKQQKSAQSRQTQPSCEIWHSATSSGKLFEQHCIKILAELSTARWNHKSFRKQIFTVFSNWIMGSIDGNPEQEVLEVLKVRCFILMKEERWEEYKLEPAYKCYPKQPAWCGSR